MPKGTYISPVGWQVIFSGFTGSAGRLLNNLYLALNRIAQVGWQPLLQTMIYTAASGVQVQWSSGNILWPSGETANVNAGNTGNLAVGVHYLYYDGSSTLKTTTVYSRAMGGDNAVLGVLEAVASGYIRYVIHGSSQRDQSFGTVHVSSLVSNTNVNVTAQVTYGSMKGGSGNNCIKFDGTNGFWIGHDTFASASGAWSLTGNITAKSGSFSNIAATGTVDGVDVSAHAHSGAGQGGTVDHGNLSGLSDDDHSQYLNTTRHTALTHSLAASEIASGTFNISRGGTGLSNFSVGDMFYYATGTTLRTISIGSLNNYLRSNGIAPGWAQIQHSHLGGVTRGQHHIHSSSGAYKGAVWVSASELHWHDGTNHYYISGSLA